MACLTIRLEEVVGQVSVKNTERQLDEKKHLHSVTGVGALEKKGAMHSSYNTDKHESAGMNFIRPAQPMGPALIKKVVNFYNHSNIFKMAIMQVATDSARLP